MLGDPLSIAISDPDHSDVEERFLLLGGTSTERFLVLAIAERGSVIRIINARVMTPRERKAYEREVER